MKSELITTRLMVYVLALVTLSGSYLMVDGSHLRAAAKLCIGSAVAGAAPSCGHNCGAPGPRHLVRLSRAGSGNVGERLSTKGRQNATQPVACTLRAAPSVLTTSRSARPSCLPDPATAHGSNLHMLMNLVLTSTASSTYHTLRVTPSSAALPAGACRAYEASALDPGVRNLFAQKSPTCQRSSAMLVAIVLHSASPFAVVWIRPPGWSMQQGKCHPNICSQRGTRDCRTTFIMLELR